MYMRQLVGRGMSHLSHQDPHVPRITRDEADVQSIVKLLEDDWTNPFDQMKVSLSAFRHVARDIHDAHKIGMAAYGEFTRDRLEDETPKAQFHDKITKKRLETRYPKEDFCKQFKQRHSTSRNESICPYGPCGRETPSPDERCPFPPTRTIVMGARQWRRDNKKYEQRCSGYGVGKAGVTSRNHPEPSATIIDGMSMVQ